MVKKEKIFELKIQEDDDLSGIDSISLVDTPAIEVNWVAFKSDCETGKCNINHDFSSDDEKYVSHIMTNAETEDDLLNSGWSIDSIEIVTGKENFVTTNPNAPSAEDEKEYKVRYKYILNPKINGPALIDTSRDFCKELIRQNKVFRVEDIESAVNDFGQSPLVYRGSWNCRHVWARIKYRNDAEIINKASVNKGKVMVDGFPNDATPDVRVLGYAEPSTVTNVVKKAISKGTAAPSTASHLGLSKQFDFVGPKVSFDYDDTFSTERGKKEAKLLQMEGYDIHIVTRRQQSQGAEVYKAAAEFGIPRDHVHFTNGDWKWKTLLKLGIKKHYDNNYEEIKRIRENAPDIKAVQFDYDVSGISGYVDPGISGKTKNYMSEFEYLFSTEDISLHDETFTETFGTIEDEKINFESYSDYPDSVKNNAKAVLKYADENGWGSCGTSVGKQRANQLAKGEPISLDTIKRMYSYLSRHAGDLDSSKGYGDGCGKLMYDSWGGKSALSWAEAKIKSVEKEKMSKQNFSVDNEEQQIVLGPAMIPNQKIFRKDNNGNPYYVYFSPETIKMIAGKYMKNKYTDNNDQMHDGKAVKDVYVLESWIKEDMSYDKGNKYGYNDLPVGTWFVSMKVNNLDIWNKIKEGVLNGFSVSGYFEEIAQFSREEMFLQRLADLLKVVPN